MLKAINLNFWLETTEFGTNVRPVEETNIYKICYLSIYRE